MMELTPEKYIERLNEITSKKHLLLAEMLEITGMQREVIEEDRIEALHKLIEKKQKVIEAVNKLDDEFEVYFSRLKSVLGINSLEELNNKNIEGLGQLKETVAKIMDLLGKISFHDKHNTGGVKKKFDDISGEIKRLNQGRRLAGAYMQAPVQSVSYYIDRKK